MNNNLDIAQFGQVVAHFDGNNNDKDDISALPIAAAFTNAAELQDKTTFFYNNNLGEPNVQGQVNAMRESAAFAEKLGIDTYDYQANIDGTTDELVAILNSGEKVLSLEGGPMEAIYRGLEIVGETNPQNLSNITLVSHSSWNENRDKASKSGVDDVRTWSDIERDFPEVTLIEIADQNGGSGGVGFFSGKWSWLDSTENPVLSEARRLMENANEKNDDASDAGMLFYAITGNENGDPDDAKVFLEANSPEYASNSPENPTTNDVLEVGLYDADSDTLIQTIEDGDRISVNTQNLAIAASVPEDSSLFGQVESVLLDFNDGQNVKKENVEPYALFGDSADDLKGGSIPVGDNTIALDLYSENNLKGELLQTVTRNFTIVDESIIEPPVVSDLVVGLYDADSDTLIQTIEDGTQISVDTQNLSIAAFVPEDSSLFGRAESISLDLNDSQIVRKENVEPYTLFGDSAENMKGGSIPIGDNTIVFDVYSEDNLKGDLLQTVTRSFTIIDD